MKKWWIIPVLFVLLAIVVDAKCGDSFCDPNEDCTTCADDCLCTRDKHGDQVNCTTLFTSQECEKGYCDDKWCSTLEGFISMFQKATCSDNGSISLTIKFQELDSVVLTPVEDLKVYMKLGEESTFEEIKGVWYNPSREGDFRYTKIRDTSDFNSDTDLFKTKGDYYVRVKYRVGMSSILFEDKKISCPGMPQATPPAEEPVEEKLEEQAQIANPASVYCKEQGGELDMRETPEGTIGYCLLPDGTECEEWAYFRGECPKKEETQPRACRSEGEFCGGIAGIICCEGMTCQYDGDYPDAGGTCVKGLSKKTVEEPAEQAPKESKKSKIIWYVILGIIILGAIFFFIKYEIKVAKRIEQQ